MTPPGGGQPTAATAAVLFFEAVCTCQAQLDGAAELRICTNIRMGKGKGKEKKGEERRREEKRGEEEDDLTN